MTEARAAAAMPHDDPPSPVHPLTGDASAAEPPPHAAPREAQARDRQLAEAIDHLGLDPVQRAYLHERWVGQLSYLSHGARRAQRRYYGLRLVAILGGVLVPALIGLNNTYSHWVAFVLGLLVAAAVALEEFFRFGDRWRHFRQQSELLRSEGWMYLEGAGPTYRRYDTPAEGFRTFVNRAEEAMRREVGVYIAEVVRATEEPQHAAVRGAAAPPRGGGVASPPAERGARATP